MITETAKIKELMDVATTNKKLTCDSIEDKDWRLLAYLYAIAQELTKSEEEGYLLPNAVIQQACDNIMTERQIYKDIIYDAIAHAAILFLADEMADCWLPVSKNKTNDIIEDNLGAIIRETSYLYEIEEGKLLLNHFNTWKWGCIFYGNKDWTPYISQIKNMRN